MSYQVHNFQTGEIIEAAPVNEMDQQIQTNERNISGKADKVSSATEGNFASLDSEGNIVDSGHKHSDYLTQHQDISGKADKVSGATSGNFASLDSNGNLIDSGHKHSDYTLASEVGTVPSGQTVEGQITALNGKIVSLEGRKANAENLYMYKDATPGPIVTVDDAVAEAVKQMKIAIEPVQDLHGYANPWPGGGGANLLNANNPITFTQRIDIPLPRALPSGTTVYVYRKSYSYTVEPSSGSKYPYVVLRDSQTGTNRNGIWVNPDSTKSNVVANGDFDTLRIWSNGNSSANSADVEVTIADLVIGTVEVDAYAPYSNVCAISGWDECNVTRTGKNLLWFSDGTDTSLSRRSCSISDNVVTVTGTGAVSSNVIVGGSNALLNGKYYPAGTYTFVQKVISNTTGVDISLRPIISDGTTTTTQEVGVPFTSAVPFKLQSISNSPQITWSSGMVVSFELALVKGSDAMFEHYNGETYQITFPQEAGTVYGGTLTVNADGSGTLVVDRAYALLNDSNKWSQQTGYIDYSQEFIDRKLYNNSYTGLVSSYYKVDSSDYQHTIRWSSSSGFRIRLYDSNLSIDDIRTDATAGKIAIVYELATPQVYTLTAPQVETLKSYNVIFADCGDIESFLYATEKYHDDRYANRIYNTIDDQTIASFTDGAEEVPLKTMTVGIEPVQDLHGYDNPWPAGGGVQLLNVLNPVKFTQIIDVPLGKIIPSGTTIYVYRDSFAYTVEPSTGSKYPVAVFRNSSTSTNHGNIWINPTDKKSSTTINGDIDTVRIYSNGYSSVDSSGVEVTINGLVVSLTEANAYTPYSNICPISGWTGANVTRTGVNIWDEQWELGSIKVSNGENQSDSTRIRTKNFISVSPGTKYYKKTPNAFWNLYYAADKSYIGYGNSAQGEFTTPENCHYMRFSCESSYGTTYNNDISINYPYTDTQYHPGQVGTYQIAFPSEAGTVYGGTLTVNADGTGTLVVEYKHFTENGSASWSEVTTGGNRWVLGGVISDSQNLDTTGVCNFGKLISSFIDDGIVTQSNGRINLCGSLYSAFASANALETYLASNPLQLVYKLATPVTYTLSALEVIETLKGNNNIFADTGEVLAVEYSADTKLYIDGKIAELLASINS